jgi:vacuolar protein sorting-associated protein 72
VITSLPSRYRDPETSLPYANSYAYGQIRRMLSQGYIWSSMLGCFVGPGGTAARGVPDRFLGIETKAGEDAEKKEDKEKKPEGGAADDSKADPMEIDAK